MIDLVRKYAGQKTTDSSDTLKLCKGKDGTMWLNHLEPLVVFNSTVFTRQDYAKMFKKFEQQHKDLIVANSEFTERLSKIG
jgi:hypothetical protein